MSSTETTAVPASDKLLWTVGHSNREAAAFVALLTGQAITLVADVRRYPASRKHPQFNGPELAATLAAAGIEYQHLPGLGGRRSARKADSPNTAWRVEAFNAYADHMQSDEFREAMTQLINLAASRRTAVMCAEALPWQCHRRLIADGFLARGWHVLDIIGPENVRPHELTEFARLEGETVTYPGGRLF